MAALLLPDRWVNRYVDRRLCLNRWVGHVSTAPPQFLLRALSTASHSVVEQLVGLNDAMVHQRRCLDKPKHVWQLSRSEASTIRAEVLWIEQQLSEVTGLDSNQSGAEMAQSLAGNALAIGAEVLGRLSQHPDIDALDQLTTSLGLGSKDWAAAAAEEAERRRPIMLPASKMMELSNQQEQVVQQQRSVFVQGRSGTGKTLTIIGNATDCYWTAEQYMQQRVPPCLQQQCVPPCLQQQCVPPCLRQQCVLWEQCMQQYLQ